MLQFLTKYFSDTRTPRTNHTDNGSCFKSKELKEFCNGENLKRTRCTPISHTGSGLVARTVWTFESLARATPEDGLPFEENVQLAIRTNTQTPHSKLNMTPFQMQLGCKPRTAITNLIDQPA